MRKKNITIGIIGVGMVGTAVLKYYQQKQNVRLYQYDKKKNLMRPDNFFVLARNQKWLSIL